MKTISLLSSRHNSLYIGGSGNNLGLEIRLLYIDQPSDVFTVNLDMPLLFLTIKKAETEVCRTFKTN